MPTDRNEVRSDKVLEVHREEEEEEEDAMRDEARGEEATSSCDTRPDISRGGNEHNAWPAENDDELCGAIDASEIADDDDLIFLNPSFRGERGRKGRSTRRRLSYARRQLRELQQSERREKAIGRVTDVHEAMMTSDAPFDANRRLRSLERPPLPLLLPPQPQPPTPTTTPTTVGTR